MGYIFHENEYDARLATVLLFTVSSAVPHIYIYIKDLQFQPRPEDEDLSPDPHTPDNDR